MLRVDSVVTSDDDSRNQWRILGRLGEGTCCEVYRAQRIHKPYTKAALKIYRDGENYERAHDAEAMLLQLVNRANGHCVNLVTTIDDFDLDSRPCLVQELLDLDLRQILTLNQGQGLSLYLVQKLSSDILRGVGHLHKSGFIHADLKPANLLWSPGDGCVKVIDYSLSYHRQDQGIGRIQSNGYISPEAEEWNTFVIQQTVIDELTESCEHSNCEPPGTRQESNATSSSNAVHSSDTSSNSVTVSTNSSNKKSPKAPEPSQQPTSLPNSSSTSSQSTSDEDTNCSKVHPRVPSWPADMWSVGCLIYELSTGVKLFTNARKQEMLLEAEEQSMQSVIYDTVLRDLQPASGTISEACALVVSLITGLLCTDPTHRLTAEGALQHDFFSKTLEPSFLDYCVLPGPVLRLMNVVEEGDLATEQACNDLRVDLMGECARYGPLQGCVVPQDGPGKGKVFVEYSEWEDAHTAYSKLCTREYNGHSVVVSYYPPEDYRRGLYS